MDGIFQYWISERPGSKQDELAECGEADTGSDAGCGSCVELGEL